MVQQPPKLSSFDRLKAQADLHFREGSYQKAVNLYKACLNFPYLENPQVLKNQLAKAQQLIQLDDQAMAEVRRGNNRKALELIEQLLKVNPTDPYAKVSQKDLKEALARPPISQNQRLKNRLNAYIASGEWEKAANILNVIDVLPNGQQDKEVIANRKMVNDMMAYEREALKYRANNDVSNFNRIKTLIAKKYPEAASSSVFKNTAVAQSATSTAPLFYSVCTVALEKATAEMTSCNFIKAQATLTAVREKYKVECQNDSRLSRKLTTLRNIEQNLYTINSLKPDLSKRAIVSQSFERMLKMAPGCIRESYFNYIYQEGLTNKFNGNCAGAILSFQKAKRVSPSLSKSFYLDREISIQTDTCNCREKGKVLLSELQRADALYRTCECDSAVIAWQNSIKYLCDNNKTGKNSWEVWRDKAVDCEKNKTLTNQFSALLVRADKLVEEGQCKEARHLYQTADSLRTRCGTLNKQIIVSSIAKCDKCLQKQCFDSTMAKAEQSQQANFQKDALKYFREALACNPPADQLSRLNEIIHKLECQVENINCPPTTEVTVAKAVNHLTKLSIIGGSNRIFPELNSTLYPLKNVTGWYGYTGGMRFDYISLKTPLSFYANLLYTSTLIYGLADNKTYADELFHFGYSELSAGIKVHSPKRKEGKPRLYLHGGFGLMVPVVYRYKVSI